LAKQGSQQVYIIIPKSKKWLIINYVVNATKTTLPRFYILEERGYVMTTYNSTNQELIWLCNKKMDDYLSFQKQFVFFKRFIPCEIFLTNRHLLILDGHGSHVTLEVIEQAKKFRPNMITLPSHTSHVFSPLDVVYFKPFKTVSKET
jgi:hypothetical protein